MKHLIIGNGVAGTTAALNIRKFDESAEISIITDEDIPFYSRMRLSEYLSGETDEKKLILHNDAWYENNRINLIMNKRVVLIEPGAKQIILDGNMRIPYDRLLVATGSKPAIPVLGGVDKKGVFSLRTLADARRIKAFSERTISVIVLGGGVLGLEIGNAFRKSGRSVTIVEYFPRLLPKQMDVEGSRIFREKLESYGLSFCLDARAEEVLGDDSVEGLRLQDGKRAHGQMLVISSGIIPEVSLFNGTGIVLGRGVPVNDRMETDLPNVYAAGDVAEHCQTIYGIWPAAEKQGEVAGVNMAGGNATYGGTTPSHFITVAGIEVFSAGEFDVDCRLPSLVYKDTEKGIYKKIVVRDDSIVGCIFCGDTTGRKEVISAIQEKRPVRDMQQTFEKLNVTWMPSPE